MAPLHLPQRRHPPASADWVLRTAAGDRGGPPAGMVAHVVDVFARLRPGSRRDCGVPAKRHPLEALVDDCRAPSRPCSIRSNARSRWASRISRSRCRVIGVSSWVNAGFPGAGGPVDHGTQAGDQVPRPGRQAYAARKRPAKLFGPGPFIVHGHQGVLAPILQVNPDGIRRGRPAPAAGWRLRLAGCSRLPVLGMYV